MYKTSKMTIYQMDNIWWAAKIPRKSPGPLILEHKAIIFGRSLWRTLYSWLSLYTNSWYNDWYGMRVGLYDYGWNQMHAEMNLFQVLIELHVWPLTLMFIILTFHYAIISKRAGCRTRSAHSSYCKSSREEFSIWKVSTAAKMTLLSLMRTRAHSISELGRF